jgi:peroxiredoxin
LRDAYAAVREAGGEVVAVGTGNPDFARAFVDDYAIPYPVLIDAEARAARAATIGRMSFLGMFTPASYPGTVRAWRSGHRIGASGTRVTQLGATFVVGPGPSLVFEHRNVHGADHPALEAVLASLSLPGTRSRESG